MSDPSFSDTLSFAQEQNRNKTAVERDWWNRSSSVEKRRILGQIDFNDIGIYTASENAYQQDNMAKINQLVETHYDSLPEPVKANITESLIAMGGLPNPSDYLGISNMYAVGKEVWHECDRCDESFMAEEDFDLHKEIDHGDSTEFNEPAEEGFTLSMNPDVNAYALHEARVALAETKEDDLHRKNYFNGSSLDFPTTSEPKADDSDAGGNTIAGIQGYNPNPNEGLYDTKEFTTGKAKQRSSVESAGGYCNKCGTYSYASMTSHMKDRHPAVPRAYWKTLEYFGSTVNGDDKFVGDGIAQKYYDNTGELEKAMGWAPKDDGWSSDFDKSNKPANPYYSITHGENIFNASPSNEADNYPSDHKTNPDWEEDFLDIKNKYENSGNEADNYPSDHKRNDDWDDDFQQLKSDYQGRGTDVVYENDGLSDISAVPETIKEDGLEYLDNLDLGYESIEPYPTKANENTKSYITEAEADIQEEYAEFGQEESEDELVTEMINERKMAGYSPETIANEIRIMYGVSPEDAISKVNSVEVSINDRIANTFFQKPYNQCNESEKQELALYSGADNQ